MSEMRGLVDQMDLDTAGRRNCAAAEEAARAETLNRPSYILRPALSIDGNQWCALYGANLQDGVAGFGDSPEAAYQDFDKAWVKPLATATGEGK